jgi:hypothetical protein
MTIRAKFGDLHSAVISELSNAKSTLYIAVAWITFEIYREVLVRLKNSGVNITIYCSDSPPNRKQLSTINDLKNSGIQITLYKMPNTNNYMHHKFAIIDESTVINGSFNWSRNAMKSFENLLIIKDDLEIVREFMCEFNKLATLDTNAIKTLQSVKKCLNSKCNGKLINILVFGSNPMEMTYEIWGDLVQLCSECGEDNFVVLKHGVQDTLLHSFNSSNEILDDFEDGVERQKYIFDRDLDEYLTGYSVDRNTIHAIGFVVGEIVDRTDWKTYTNIVWKNKFVEDLVFDSYETNFDVVYD